MSGEYIAPEYQKKGFNCPHCGVRAHQQWHDICMYSHTYFMEETQYFLKKHERMTSKFVSYSSLNETGQFFNDIFNSINIKTSKIAVCFGCKDYSIWVNEKLVYPDSSPAPLPTSDMPKSVKDIYNEARSIAHNSPRAAAALLRLSIQTLIKELGEDENNLNQVIGNLVKKGLPSQIQQALDSVRVIGNNAVHPGQIDIKDNLELAGTLFELVNLICEKMITDDKKIKNIFASLPEDSKKAIEKRDHNNEQ